MAMHHWRGATRLATILTAFIVSVLSASSQAASFTSGNVVVYRLGDGTSSLTANGNAVFLDEYTAAGTLVQSIALPTTVNGSNNQLIASGTASSEGLLTRSTNGQYLLLTGYSRNLGGSTSLSGTSSTAVPRTVGRVKYDGTVDTSTALTDFATANNPRSAASTDGLDIWVTGAAGGVRYTRYSAFGTTISTQLSTDVTNGEQVVIFSGQLYVSTQKLSLRLATVGTGTPTAAGQTITNLPGFPTSTGNPDGFFLADLDGSPGLDTLYVADDTAGQIQKYALIAGSWTAKGSIAAPNVHGLTAMVGGTTVTLYATGSTGSDGTLYTFTDTTGYGASVSGSAAVVRSAAGNEAFRGVALAPVNSLPATPTATATSTAPAGPTPTRTATQLPSATLSATRTPSPTQSSLQSTATSTATAALTPVNTATTSPTPGGQAHAPFTAGNLVIYRVGDGMAPLGDSGNAVFLNEYTPGGVLVQSVALPTTAGLAPLSNPLIASTDSSEGLLARSSDEQYLLLTGYALPLGDPLPGGATTLFGTTAAAVPRAVGRVKYDGTIDTSTALTDLSSANNPRSATSTDGINIWVGGASGSSGGVHYATLGATTSTQLFGTIPKGVRQVNIFGGQLYFDSNTTGLLNVSAVGSGTPTTGGQSGTELPGLPDTAGNDGYWFADLGDGHGLATLYVANDTLGEILKYTLVSDSWTTSGTITAAGAHGVTGVVSGTDVMLFATGTTGSDGSLYSFIDATGYAGMVSGTATTVVSAPTNEAFRGIALAPVSTAAPTSPTATATPTIMPGGPTFTRTATATLTNTPTITQMATITGTPTQTATPTATAGAFAGGNVVVYRIGDGTSALSSGVGAPVFLDEYSATGTLVQSVPLPTTASGTTNPLVASGTAGTEGQLTRSVDGQYLLLTGYAAAVGTANLTKSTADVVPRTVGRVDYSGAIDTTTALTDFSSGDKPRGAASTDGTNLWLSCGGKATGTTDSIHYATLASTTSTQLSATFGDSREVNIYDGQLYISSQNSGGAVIGAVGTGVPTTAPQITTAIPGFDGAGAPEGFVFADLDGSPGVDTLYVADEVAGLQKWSLVSDSWVLNNAIAPAADVLYGLTGVAHGSTVTLYATGSSTSNDKGTLYGFTDSGGYNFALSGTLSVLATAPANETFRGVALAPAALGSGATPTAIATSTQPQSATATPTHTSTPTTIPSETPTAINTDTPTSGATPTTTPTSIATTTQASTPPLTRTPTPAATRTPSGTSTPTLPPAVTDTPTWTATEIVSPSPTPTQPVSPTLTVTDTPAATPTDTGPPAPTDTATASPTPSATETPSPSATPISCVGDCDRGGSVTVDELITMVNIALGNSPLADCPAGDADRSGTITIDEIITAVNHALDGCSMG